MTQLTILEFTSLRFLDLVVDGFQGGVIKAPSHDGGGANIIRLHEGAFDIVGELEGWEYLMNPFATKIYKRRIVEINDELKDSTDEFTGFEIPVETNIIDLTLNKPVFGHTAKFILMRDYPCFIINKYSTRKYINELNFMNRNATGVFKSPYLGGDFNTGVPGLK